MAEVAGSARGVIERPRLRLACAIRSATVRMPAAGCAVSIEGNLIIIATGAKSRSGW